jgi:aryl-alcohol dehydrogenase-like predicted oxidoreductase
VVVQFTSIPDVREEVSVLCLGVAEHGSNISRDESFAMLDAFAEAGGNFADSAHIYAAWLEGGVGQSERTLGQWLAARRPSGFLVGTKGGHPVLETMHISRLSPEDIARDLDESLERLQQDSVALYYLHRDDEAVPVSEIMDALNEHVSAGRVGALGASNWSAQRIEEANAYAAQHNKRGFCASQIGWSLAEVSPQARGAALTVQMDDATLAWHRRSGFPQIAYSSQANGLFAHPEFPFDAPSTPKQKALAHSYGTSRNAVRRQKSEALARELGRTPNEIALAYVWSQSFPGVAVIGPRRVEQIHDSLRAADLRLSPEQVALLEQDG